MDSSNWKKKKKEGKKESKILDTSLMQCEKGSSHYFSFSDIHIFHFLTYIFARCWLKNNLICDVIKQNKSELTNAVFFLYSQTEQTVLLFFIVLQSSTIFTFRTNSSITVSVCLFVCYVFAPNRKLKIILSDFEFIMLDFVCIWKFQLLELCKL